MRRNWNYPARVTAGITYQHQGIMDYITTKKEARTEPHFAALVFTTVHIPGDERSRTHPGHGYPAEAKSIVQYITFESREELEGWVLEQESKVKVSKYWREDYQVIEVKPLTVSVVKGVTIS